MPTKKSRTGKRTMKKLTKQQIKELKDYIESLPPEQKELAIAFLSLMVKSVEC